MPLHLRPKEAQGGDLAGREAGANRVATVALPCPGLRATRPRAAGFIAMGCSFLDPSRATARQGQLTSNLEWGDGEAGSTLSISESRIRLGPGSADDDFDRIAKNKWLQHLKTLSPESTK